MKVVVYIRVSTKKQDISPEVQEEKLRQYAGLYGHKIIEVIVEKKTGKVAKERPGLQKALSLLENGQAEGILVHKLDRLTRSIKDLCEMTDKYFAKGHALISLSENLDTDSASGRLVMNILAVVSQWEREVISERTSAALQHKKSKNEFTGGRVPYGYRHNKGDKKLEKDPKEQGAIRLAKSLRGEGYSLRKIAKLMSKDGYLSRSKKVFTAKQIMNILAT